MGCYPQKFVDDILRQKTSIATFCRLQQETVTVVVFRAGSVRRIKEDIRVDDESHCLLFHDSFERLSIRQIDFRATHTKYG
jgi:hypothetical protein